jgi:hypothetical protein
MYIYIHINEYIYVCIYIYTDLCRYICIYPNIVNISTLTKATSNGVPKQTATEPLLIPEKAFMPKLSGFPPFLSIK